MKDTTSNLASETPELLSVHWGWVTPGVPDCNRTLQEAVYLGFLSAEAGSGDKFNFTQPGWVLDGNLSADLRAITEGNPEPGFRGGPFCEATLQALREAVRTGQITYLAYPYSGAIVEGMLGESVLRSFLLTVETVREQLGVTPSGFFVHDGISQLDWNAPAMIQVGALLGMRAIYGRASALAESPDGTRLPMLGLRPGSIDGVVTDAMELVDAPEHVFALRQRYGGRFICVDDLPQSAFANLSVRDANSVISKGWYGGTMQVLQMQASLRRSDYLLTAYEAAAAVIGRKIDTLDLWKRSLILQDCHLQWLLHDVDSHYLPEARRHERAMRERLATLLTDSAAGSTEYVFNPLPFERSAVVPVGNTYCFAPSLPAFGASDKLVARTVLVSSSGLQNDKIQVSLGPAGEIFSVESAKGGTLYSGVSNRLIRWRNVPASGEFDITTGVMHEMPGYRGCITLTTEIDVPESGEYEFRFGVERGMTIVVEEADWVCATNRHWGGGLPGAPGRPQDWASGKLMLHEGRRTITLHAVSDGGLYLADATFKRGGHVISPMNWRGHKRSEWAIDPFVVDRVESVEQGARGSLIFHGRFAVCDAVMRISLDWGSETVNCTLTRQYPSPVFEGFETLPIPLGIGSYLGGCCERPYVPAYTVESEVPPRVTRYFTDKPYGFAEARHDAECWPNGGFYDLFNGMAPILGVTTAIAEDPNGGQVLMTDGHNHFFRRRSDGAENEWLGLSLGVASIHPQTQGYKMPIGSPWDRIGRHMKTDYNDAHDTCAFVAASGEITTSWSWLFPSPGPVDRAACVRLQQARLVAPVVDDRPVDGGFEFDSCGAVVAGIEARDGVLVARIVNYAEHPAPFRLAIGEAIGSARSAGGLEIPDLGVGAKEVTGTLPALAVREIEIGKADGTTLPTN